MIFIIPIKFFKQFKTNCRNRRRSSVRGQWRIQKIFHKEIIHIICHRSESRLFNGCRKRHSRSPALWRKRKKLMVVFYQMLRFRLLKMVWYKKILKIIIDVLIAFSSQLAKVCSLPSLCSTLVFILHSSSQNFR